MRVLLTMPLLVTAVLAQDAAHDRFVTTLQQHAVAIGAAGGLPASWRTVATRTEGGRQTTVRTFVRRSPFALRRELETEGRSHVSLTDGHLAWHGDGRPLPAAQARELLDTALLDGLLYLDPDRVAGGPDTDTPWPLREHAALPPDLSGPRTSNWIASRSPSGRLLQLHFDAADHQLLEAADATPGGSRSWTRYGLPRRLASLSLPTLRASGRIGEPTTAVWQVEAVEIDVTLPDDLFAGCPQVETPRVQSLGQMLTCVHATPGNAYLVLPAVLVNGNPVEALVDTGASRSALVPRLATTLRVPAGGPIAAHAFAGSVQMQSAWLDEVRAGERIRLQRTVAVSHLPGIYPRPRDRQPAMLFAIDLFDDSPVLDLAGAELLCRGTPVTPLAELADRRKSARVVTTPLRWLPDGAPMVTIEIDGVAIDAVIDSGSPGTLRLGKAALQRCNLPTDAPTWIARGALRSSGQQTGGAVYEELVIAGEPLAAFHIGPVRFERAIVYLSGLDGDAPLPYDAFLGAGALLPFRRVGFDRQRGLLELDPGDHVERRDDGTLVVPPPGPLLGLHLGAAGAATPEGVVRLPTVTQVLPGSAAANAGLREGQQVWAIDGVPCPTLSMDTICRRFWDIGNGALKVSILGDPVPHVLRAP